MPRVQPLWGLGRTGHDVTATYECHITVLGTVGTVVCKLITEIEIVYQSLTCQCFEKLLWLPQYVSLLCPCVTTPRRVFRSTSSPPKIVLALAGLF